MEDDKAALIEDIEPVFIDERETARITKRAVQSLRNDRTEGRGLPYYKHGRSVRYFLPEIYQHMLSHRIVPRNPNMAGHGYAKRSQGIASRAFCDEKQAITKKARR